jgi:hypothetical protein
MVPHGEAEHLFRRLLVIQETFLGPDHPETAETLEHLAALCRRTGRQEEARNFEVRAGKIRSSAGARP